MDLRSSIWTILSHVAAEGEHVLLSVHAPPHELSRVSRFVNRVRDVMLRINGPRRTVPARILQRLIDDLVRECSGVLEPLAEPLGRARRRTAELAGRRRRASSKCAKPSASAADATTEPVL